MPRVTLSPELTGVTVYNDSAQLSFSAQVPLQASTAMVVVLENMERYGNVDWSTLQLRVDRDTDPAVASAVLLQNINPIHDTVTEDVRADVQRVQDELKAIEEEKAVCQEELEILQETCEHLDEIQHYVHANAFSVPNQNDESGQKYFQKYLQNTANWSSTGTFFASRKAAAQRKTATLHVEMEEIEKRRGAAWRKLSDLGGDSGVRTHLKNTLEATLVVADSVPAATKLRLEMSCVVSGAGWSPLYDLRVDYATAMMDVFYYANVRQCTSVDWEKVRLRLSTATPHTGGSPPPLWPQWKISLSPPPQPRPFRAVMRNARMKRAGGFGGGASNGMPAAACAPMLEQAEVESGGSSSSSTVYAIPGLATVRHNNVEVKVTVAHERFPVKLQFVSIPKLDPLTHLSATAVNSTDFEFIAGPSKVFYGTTFVNHSQLGNVSPGEEFQVSLGADETVTVNRSLVRRGESEMTAFFSGSKSQLEFHHAYEVKCGALAASGPVTVVVKDNYPVSDDSEVTVSLKEPVPTDGDKPSSVKGATVTVDEDTHEIAWTFQMQKQEKKHFDMVFIAQYPEKTDTFGLD
ncbi:putative mitochondrial hypothetical protein [Leptomonas pyrrhocoris]|uniref:DUF4139 domain-containing protein n=1 Tax=Leptomonas pyrrhocoris TaxID=157538 RepID=A0A0M9G610_LEPPY|nr:putative mitochondrial hypothetical protein [Leptomonas pyrrhocoris]KPA83103.1 putative mitochondrial hypothetical protein [Leptomonas pyrrhocoris]|eukprot:XP_015661542.1 putative mitochondrial hypothetical protein [Leptomonas pyrrhocoris]